MSGDVDHTYSEAFFGYIDAGARRSALAVIGAAAELISGPVTSVLDVGCGHGAWLSVWAGSGVTRVRGVDGMYVDPGALSIEPSAFTAADLNRPLDLGERFDVVQSLEVAEHLRPSASETFAATLAAHGDLVVFSAAVPGQGGEKHINERPLGYWRDVFGALGYRCFDCMRPMLAGDAGVEPWYRYNTLVYARGEGIGGGTGVGVGRLTDRALACEIDAGKPVPDVASARWKMRRAVLRPLPEPVVTALAVGTQRLRRTPAGR